MAYYCSRISDEELVKLLWAAARFTSWAVDRELILVFLLSQLPTHDFVGKNTFCTIHALLLPITLIAVGATWRLMVIPGFGSVPYYLDRWFDIPYNVGTFASHAFATAISMDIWHWTPLVTLYGYGSALSLLILCFTIVLCWLLFITTTQTGRGGQTD